MLNFFSNFLSNPAWQGIGVIIALVLGFIGFYYAGKNKLWLYLSGVIVVFIIGFSLGINLQTPSTSMPSTSMPIPVDSTKDWQETGINLQKGNTVTISVVGGAWTIWRRNVGKTKTPGGELWEYVLPENTGEGLELKCSECPIPKAKKASLIAKIINPENSLLIDTFEVGNEIRHTAPFDGLTSLRINDSVLNDNAGILLTKIKVEDLSKN